MAGPAAVQTTDGGGHRLGYLGWDYHERSPAEFATVFKDKVAGPLGDQGLFASKAGASVATQSGVIRTNCLDSLDRTNKVQTKLAYWNLPEQLASLGLSMPAALSAHEWHDLSDPSDWPPLPTADGAELAGGVGGVWWHHAASGRSGALAAVQDLQVLLDEKTLSPTDTLVWAEGWSEWRLLDEAAGALSLHLQTASDAEAASAEEFERAFRRLWRRNGDAISTVE